MNMQILDTRGLNCPIPVIRARKAIKSIETGHLLRIECTDPLAEIDIPHMVNTDGHELVEKGKDAEVLWYLIRIAKR